MILTAMLANSLSIEEYRIIFWFNSAESYVSPSRTH